MSINSASEINKDTTVGRLHCGFKELTVEDLIKYQKCDAQKAGKFWFGMNLFIHFKGWSTKNHGVKEVFTKLEPNKRAAIIKQHPELESLILTDKVGTEVISKLNNSEKTPSEITKQVEPIANGSSPQQEQTSKKTDQKKREILIGTQRNLGSGNPATTDDNKNKTQETASPAKPAQKAEDTTLNKNQQAASLRTSRKDKEQPVASLETSGNDLRNSKKDTKPATDNKNQTTSLQTSGKEKAKDTAKPAQDKLQKEDIALKDKNQQAAKDDNSDSDDDLDDLDLLDDEKTATQASSSTVPATTANAEVDDDDGENDDLEAFADEKRREETKQQTEEEIAKQETDFKAEIVSQSAEFKQDDNFTNLWDKLSKQTSILKNVKKNAFLDFEFFDNRRSNISCPKNTMIKVELEGKQEYIHGNQIGKKVGFPGHIIVSQAPFSHEEIERKKFWKAVFNETDVIIDLSNERDGVEEYAPKSSNTPLILDDLSVTVKDMEESSGIPIYTYDLKVGKEKNEIKRVHFKTWPDQGVVNLEQFKELVSLFDKPEFKDKKFWIHCRAGYGRSGTLAAAKILKEIKDKKGSEINKDNYVIKTLETIVALREERGSFFIQDPSQLRLLLNYMESLLNIDIQKWSETVTPQEPPKPPKPAEVKGGIKQAILLDD